MVHIVADLPPDHQFAAVIKADIAEKIEPLWDVNEVIIDFCRVRVTQSEASDLAPVARVRLFRGGAS